MSTLSIGPWFDGCSASDDAFCRRLDLVAEDNGFLFRITVLENLSSFFTLFTLTTEGVIFRLSLLITTKRYLLCLMRKVTVY